MIRRVWLRHISLGILVAGTVSAQGIEAPRTPLTLKSFHAWVSRVCVEGCVTVKPQALPAAYGNTLNTDAQMFLVRRAGQTFYVVHDVARINGRVDLTQISFLPVQVQDRWTPERLQLVSGWLQDLAGGQANSTKLWDCVASLKRNRFPVDLLDNGYGKDSLGILQLDAQTTSQGNCFWLPRQKNVAFGFTGLGFF